MPSSLRCLRGLPHCPCKPQIRYLHAQFGGFSRPRHAVLTRLACRVQNRGKKTTAILKLDELPQGVIPLEPLPLEDDKPTLPTVLQQARSNMLKFQNCVLLTRVGGFYELYFEHADEFGPLLNLKVAPKSVTVKYLDKKRKGETVEVSMVLSL